MKVSIAGCMSFFERRRAFPSQGCESRRKTDKHLDQLIELVVDTLEDSGADVSFTGTFDELEVRERLRNKMRDILK